jgi:ethanolamine ammonia-lyase small subunit
VSRDIVKDSWAALRQHTAARIALGRSGVSLPTQALLEFGAAQAEARDAVQAALDVAALEDELARRGILAGGAGALRVHSAAVDRNHYLRRPDFGRRLDAASRERVSRQRAPAPPDLVLVIGDGLSATAVARHAPALLEALLPRLTDLVLGPLVIALQARVALGDEIGELLDAAQVAVLIGERPGLSSPDSLGVYLTHAPRVGRTDAERNCLSNIRPAGLAPREAAQRLEFLIRGARQLGASGVALKDESDTGMLGPIAQAAASMSGHGPRPRDPPHDESAQRERAAHIAGGGEPEAGRDGETT